MEHFYAGDGSPVAPYHRDSSERAIFDATQYEFFGKNVVEHELGGLEDKKDDVPLEGIKDEGFSDRIWLDKDKGDGSRSSSNIYDLTNAFSKLNRAISKPRNPGDNGERVSSPMEGSPLLHPLLPQGHIRSSGTVKWFNDLKGFGFITTSNGSKDLFVHQSSIKSEGHKFLWTGEYVEFEIVRGHDGRPQAINVTGPGGTLLRGNGNNGGRGGGTTSGSGSQIGAHSFFSSNRSVYPVVGPCLNCGEMSHLEKDCHRAGRTSVQPGSRSFYTWQPGHLARNSYEGAGSGGRLGVVWCCNCGQLGHLANNCYRERLHS